MLHCAFQIMSADSSTNPHFHDWNVVFLPYCDGSSFLSDRDEPLEVNGTLLYMRGHANFHSTTSQLLSQKVISSFCT